MNQTYRYVKNPITKQKYNIASKQGKQVIYNYLKLLLGGATVVEEDLSNKTFLELNTLWSNPDTNKKVVDYFNDMDEEEITDKLEENGNFLKFMSESVKNDIDHVETALWSTQGNALQWASPDAQKDKNLVDYAVKFDTYNVKWADRDLYRDNVVFMENLMERNYQSLQFATDKVKRELNYNPNLEHEEYLEEQYQQQLQDSQFYDELEL